MIVGIWRAPLDPLQPLEKYTDFQRAVVVPALKTIKGCLGIINFHSETEWGTLQLWENREADLLSDASPQAQHIHAALVASGLLVNEGSYEWFEVHNGFIVDEFFRQFLA